jgi:hypothetical protein
MVPPCPITILLTDGPRAGAWVEPTAQRTVAPVRRFREEIAWTEVSMLKKVPAKVTQGPSPSARVAGSKTRPTLLPNTDTLCGGVLFRARLWPVARRQPKTAGLDSGSVAGGVGIE